MITNERVEAAAETLNECLLHMHVSRSEYDFDKMCEVLSIEPEAVADFLMTVLPGREPQMQKVAYAFLLGVIAARGEQPE